MMYILIGVLGYLAAWLIAYAVYTVWTSNVMDENGVDLSIQPFMIGYWMLGKIRYKFVYCETDGVYGTKKNTMFKMVIRVIGLPMILFNTMFYRTAERQKMLKVCAQIQRGMNSTT